MCLTSIIKSFSLYSCISRLGQKSTASLLGDAKAGPALAARAEYPRKGKKKGGGEGGIISLIAKPLVRGDAFQLHPCCNKTIPAMRHIRFFVSLQGELVG